MPIRDQQKIRRAAVAGRFYEGEALDLRRRMAETEAQLPPVSGRKDATPRCRNHCPPEENRVSAEKTLPSPASRRDQNLV